MHGRTAGRYTRWMAVAALALAACRGDRPEEVPGAQTVVDTTQVPTATLTLAAMDTMVWNQEDTLLVTLANRTAAAIEGARVELFVQAPATAAAAGANATADSVAGGTRVTWQLGTVAQGAAVELLQPVRTPPAPAGAARAPAFLVRATLLSRAGAPIIPAVQDTLHIRPGSERAAGGCATAGAATAQRYGIGPVRLGMKGPALRGACPEARDTTWQAEGMAEKGLVVSLGGRTAVAQMAGDSVVRILTASPELRTPAGVGTGSTVGELRTRYGRLCGAMGEGIFALWSPNAPGISFGLEPREPAPAAVLPDSLPDGLRVASLWIHGQDTPCPAQPEGNP